MIKGVTFDWLVRHYCRHFLEPNKAYLREGRFYLPEPTIGEDGSIHFSLKHPVPEGKENERTPGLLLIKNGATTIDDLISQGWLKPQAIGPSEEVQDWGDFSRYLLHQSGNDGVYIFDSDHNRMIRLYELDNNQNRDTGSLLPFLPQDFLGGRSLTEADIGTKTRLAIRIPLHLPHVETYQIKRTANQTGMGTVTRFTSQGLTDYFFLVRQVEGPHLLPEQQLAGVHHRYASKEGRIVLQEAERIKPSPEYKAVQSYAA